MNTETLINVGLSLYGTQWQSALARDLRVNDRTIRRWASGFTTVPDRIAAELATIAAGRHDELSEVLAELAHCYAKTGGDSKDIGINR